jgi:cell division protein ZapA
VSEAVNLQILDREYLVGCAEDQRDSLIDAARLLDTKMRDVRSGNRMASIDRIAILAALDIAHEFQQQSRNHAARDRDLESAIVRLTHRLDVLLDSGTIR